MHATVKDLTAKAWYFDCRFVMSDMQFYQAQLHAVNDKLHAPHSTETGRYSLIAHEFSDTHYRGSEV